MTEESQQSRELPENTVKEPENPETIVENVENALDNSAKRRGRPAGSKDKAPRKKKIVVVEEDVSEPQALPQAPALPPPEPSALPPVEPSTHTDVKPSKTKPKAIQSRKEKPQPEPEPAPEPLSPATIMREASHHILKLKSISAQARKDHIYQTYTAKLHAI